MIKEIRCQVVPMTEELIEDIATMPGTIGERPLLKARLDFLRSVAEAGNFHAPEWAVVRFKGVRYRVNGQHSSVLMTELNGNRPQTAVLREFSCDTELDMANLFDQFDARESSRSRSDVVRVHSLVEPRLSGIAPNRMYTILSGLAYSLSDFKLTRESTHDRASLQHDHVDFIEWMIAFAKHKFFYRTGVVAAAHRTWLKDAAQSGVFWRELVEESNPSPDSSTRCLARFLRDNSVIGHAPRGNARQSWPSIAFVHKCILAWNAFRRGKTTNLAWIRGGDVPDVI